LFWFQKIITVSGNRVLGRIYGVWEQGVGENIWCLGTGCWGEYMVSGNRVLGRIYGVWEQGAGENIWCLGTGCWGPRRQEITVVWRELHDEKLQK
jgi:hypothetical protein